MQINQQSTLNTYGAGTETPETDTSRIDAPPVPDDQDDIDLRTPTETLTAMRRDSRIRQWLAYVDELYEPPAEKDILLLYPCASTKPFCEAPSYKALERTLDEFDDEERDRVHVVTVSEPFALIPYEFQDGLTWTYDCPGLFEWWCSTNDEPFCARTQRQALQHLGNKIGGFLRRATNEGWYEEHVAFIRSYTGELNTSSDQTHRRMLEVAVDGSDAMVDVQPSKAVLGGLVADSDGQMAWQMQGVAHTEIQDALQERLADALKTGGGARPSESA